MTQSQLDMRISAVFTASEEKNNKNGCVMALLLINTYELIVISLPIFFNKT